jgi:hypothetical protein
LQTALLPYDRGSHVGACEPQGSSGGILFIYLIKKIGLVADVVLKDFEHDPIHVGSVGFSHENLASEIPIPATFLEMRV